MEKTLLTYIQEALETLNYTDETIAQKMQAATADPEKATEIAGNICITIRNTINNYTSFTLTDKDQLLAYIKAYNKLWKYTDKKLLLPNYDCLEQAIPTVA
jgi:hypothetical protein